MLCQPVGTVTYCMSAVQAPWLYRACAYEGQGKNRLGKPSGGLKQRVGRMAASADMRRWVSALWTDCLKTSGGTIVNGLLVCCAARCAVLCCRTLLPRPHQQATVRSAMSRVIPEAGRTMSATAFTTGTCCLPTPAEHHHHQRHLDPKNVGYFVSHLAACQAHWRQLHC
jgi:hypothetical protein